MNILLDIIIIAIIGITAFISAKRGFVRALISAVGFVLAIILAFSLSGPIAASVTENYVKPVVEEQTLSILSNASGENLNTVSENLWNELPDFVINAVASAGLTEESISDSISKSTAKTTEDLATHITDTLFIPIVESLIKAIITLVLFLILMVLVLFLSRVLNKLFSGFIFGKFNSLLGGALGILKGVVFAAVFCLVISALVGLSDKGFLSITNDTIDSTYIFIRILNVLSV